MFNLIIILLSTLNDEPKGSNNYKIAKYMIENMRDLEEYSLTDLAQACYVSNSSISRFCRDIGLKDFNALKNQIAKFSVESARLKRKFDYEKYESRAIIRETFGCNAGSRVLRTQEKSYKPFREERKRRRRDGSAGYGRKQ